MCKNALHIPADVDMPVRVIDLDAGLGELRNLQAAVGGLVDVQAHSEGDLWCSDSGRVDGLAVNVRVNVWMLNDSAAAKMGRVGEHMVIYGDVVMTGLPNWEGDTTPVTQAMIDYFSGLVVSADALRDWDTRYVGVKVTDWEL
ncbi:DUF3846 domain-containing protein [Frankia sp. AgB32]|uniref:DUF3846 domain-containing protein n=1 Tax=Frankia sp. AgB32 TaxID=631119 RepID=UPI00200DE413|nr:DUF3846 domain-containing protein [Frankia sp. AgB32]MCK9894696.1 DUF3846 domain-containing protein [Frankia sp. AgB32]